MLRGDVSSVMFKVMRFIDRGSFRFLPDEVERSVAIIHLFLAPVDLLMQLSDRVLVLEGTTNANS